MHACYDPTLRFRSSHLTCIQAESPVDSVDVDVASHGDWEDEKTTSKRKDVHEHQRPKRCANLESRGLAGIFYKVVPGAWQIYTKSDGKSTVHTKTWSMDSPPHRSAISPTHKCLCVSTTHPWESACQVDPSRMSDAPRCETRARTLHLLPIARER